MTGPIRPTRNARCARHRARALENRLAFLGTLGNNAPFIGLFGTVVGIVTAFERLGEAGRAAGAGEWRRDQ